MGTERCAGDSLSGKLGRGAFSEDDSGGAAGDKARSYGLSLMGSNSAEPGTRAGLYHHYRWVIDAQEDFDILV